MNAATAQLLDIPLEQIRPHPDNPRRNLGDLTDLAASIREQGLLEPLLVEPNEREADGGFRYQLIAGHRRLAAAAKASLTTVPAIVRPTSGLGPQIEAMLTENGQRSDLTAVEEGDAYQLLLDIPDGGYTTTSIAKKVGSSKKAVEERLRITKLPETAQQRILRGQLDLDHAARMASFANDKDAMERLDRAAQAGPIALERTLEEEKTRRTRKANLQKAERDLRKKCRADGIPYVEIDDVGTTALGLDECLPWGLVDEILKKADLDEDDLVTEEGQRALDAWHKDCPGRGFSLAEWHTGTLVPLAVCTQSELHEDERPERPSAGTPGGVAAGDEESRAAEAAARAEKATNDKALAALRRRLEAIGVTRRHFISKMASTNEANDIARAAVMSTYFDSLLASKQPHDTGRLRRLGEIVLPNASDATLSSPDLPKKIREALERTAIPKLVALGVACRGLGWEEHLEDSTSYVWRSEHNTWRKDLTEVWGWAWQPEEQALLDGRDPLDVAHEFCGDDA